MKIKSYLKMVVTTLILSVLVVTSVKADCLSHIWSDEYYKIDSLSHAHKCMECGAIDYASVADHTFIEGFCIDCSAADPSTVSEGVHVKTSEQFEAAMNDESVTNIYLDENINFKGVMPYSKGETYFYLRDDKTIDLCGYQLKVANSNTNNFIETVAGVLSVINTSEFSTPCEFNLAEDQYFVKCSGGSIIIDAAELNTGIGGFAYVSDGEATFKDVKIMSFGDKKSVVADSTYAYISVEASEINSIDLKNGSKLYLKGSKNIVVNDYITTDYPSVIYAKGKNLSEPYYTGSEITVRVPETNNFTSGNTVIANVTAENSDRFNVTSADPAFMASYSADNQAIVVSIDGGDVGSVHWKVVKKSEKDDLINYTLVIYGDAGAEGSTGNFTDPTKHPWNSFDADKKKIVDIEVESGVSIIGERVFYGMKNVESVVLEEGVETIGNEAFCECFILNSVKMASTISEIGTEAFAETAIESIVIPALSSLGNNVFDSCLALSKVSFAKEPKSISETGEIFNGCINLANVNLSCEKWSEESLKRLCLPEGIEIINDHVYEDGHCAVCGKLDVTTPTVRVKNNDELIEAAESPVVNKIIVDDEIEIVNTVNMPHGFTLDLNGNKLSSSNKTMFTFTVSENSISVSENKLTVMDSKTEGEADSGLAPFVTQSDEHAVSNTCEIDVNNTIIKSSTLASLKAAESVIRVNNSEVESINASSSAKTVIYLSDASVAGNITGNYDLYVANKSSVGGYVHINDNTNIYAYDGFSDSSAFKGNTIKLLSNDIPANATLVKNVKPASKDKFELYLSKGETNPENFVNNDVYYNVENETIELASYLSGVCGPASNKDAVKFALTIIGGTEENPEYLLTISGTGEMGEFNGEYENPWNEYKSSIVKVDIQDGVTSVSDESIKNCSKLTDVSMADTVEKIGKQAFANCTMLESIIIPEGVLAVMDEAFDGCGMLKTITIAGTPEFVQKNTESTVKGSFSGCSAVNTVNIDCSKVVCVEKYSEIIKKTGINYSATINGHKKADVLEGICANCGRVVIPLISDIADLEVGEQPEEIVFNVDFTDEEKSQIKYYYKLKTESDDKYVSDFPVTAGEYNIKIVLPAKSSFGNDVGGAEYTGCDFAAQEIIKEFKITKLHLDSSMFTVTYPEDDTYDGSEKTVAVSADGIEGIGAITVKYYDENGNLMSSAPKTKGAYSFKIDVAEGANYEAATDISDESWTFSIYKRIITSDMIKITYPQDSTWDGNEKKVTVSANGIEGIGAITVKYYDADENLLTSYPKDKGEYYIRLNIAETEMYEGWVDHELDDPDWILAITRPLGFSFEFADDDTINVENSDYKNDLYKAIYTNKQVKPEINVYHTVKKYNSNGEYIGNRDILLEAKKDYAISYSNNTKYSDEMAQPYNPETPCKLGDVKKQPRVTVKFKGNYKGTKNIYFAIVNEGSYSKSLKDAAEEKERQKKATAINNSNLVISGINAEYLFTGQEITMDDIKVSYKKDKNSATNELSLDTDIKISYINNVKAGTGTVVITGTGKNEEGKYGYKGIVKKSFKIKKVNLNSGLIEGIPKTSDGLTVFYSKTGAKPEVTLRYNDLILKPGVDYTVAYSNVSKPMSSSASKGAPKLVITGKGNFEGKTAECLYTIKPCPMNGNITAVSKDIVYSNKAGKFVSKPVVIDAKGKKLSENSDYTVEYRDASGNVLDPKKSFAPSDDCVITAYIKAMAPKNASNPSNGFYYTGDELSDVITCEYNISKDSFAQAKIVIGKKLTTGKVDKTKKTYTGDEIQLEEEDIILAEWIKGKEKRTLEYGKDFVFDEYKNNVKSGTATVVVKGLGKYAGTKNVTFIIVPNEYIEK